MKEGKTMELITGIKERRSIRRYKETEVKKELVSQIIETCRFSPTWKNSQIARFIAIYDKELIDKIATDCTYNFEYNMKTIKGSNPLIILSYVKNRSGFERDGSYTTSKGDRWEMFDSGIYAQTFCLVAHDMGLGTCILGIFDEEKVKETLGLGEDMGIGCIITLGYPVETPTAPKRKEVEELLSFK